MKMQVAALIEKSKRFTQTAPGRADPILRIQSCHQFSAQNTHSLKPSASTSQSTPNALKLSHLIWILSISLQIPIITRRQGIDFIQQCTWSANLSPQLSRKKPLANPSKGKLLQRDIPVRRTRMIQTTSSEAEAILAVASSSGHAKWPLKSLYLCQKDSNAWLP